LSLRQFLVVSCAVATLCLGLSAPAGAQIYAWRDADGRLVLSRQPIPGATPVPSFPVVKATPQVRTTRFAAVQRAELYDDLISEHAKLHGIRTDLVRAVVQVESAFNTYAKSPKGAMGLMQLMPGTAQQFGVRNPFNPVENIRAGVAYLRQLLDRYQNNEELALAAYNAGPQAVDRHGQAVPPYRETKNYVAQINHLAARPVATRGTSIYKVTEIIDGRPVTRYTDKLPSTGPYQVVGTR
jgi:soluble lytic murein transglycosylase-like protein